VADVNVKDLGGQPLLGDADAEILSVLGKLRFSSVWTIADSLGVLASTHIE
jgi:hypothetical protein